MGYTASSVVGHGSRRYRRLRLLAVVVVAATGCTASSTSKPPAPAPTPTLPVAPLIVAPARPPSPKLACIVQSDGTISGAYGTASAMGWPGNHYGVVACLGGSFFVQGAIYRSFGFGLYTGAQTAWTNAEGYLPAMVTRFATGGVQVVITEFADRAVIGGQAFVLVYSRVEVDNPTRRAALAAPGPSVGFTTLATASDQVAPQGRSVHDYVLAVDRLGANYPWPSASALLDAGTFDVHYAHMRDFWNGELAQITQLQVPDQALDDAYRSGFIYTQIARSGGQINTGVNNYESEFSHDVIGILANLFTQGYYTDAHALLLEARSVIGAQGQYIDGVWTYAWPWAVYLLKTGDLAFVRANFAARGPAGAAEPSIMDAAHAIAAARTGPGGIIGVTDDIDTKGYWTVDDYEALMGLAAYRYLAQRVGDAAEVQWAAAQYDNLLAATNGTLNATIAKFNLTYLPCSILAPNTANRCNNPQDANWAAPFVLGRWAWDGQLFGATMNGPGVALIDATYDYGFGRLRGVLPPNTFGGFPDFYYSSGYNAGYGSWGLASQGHRDQGILSYQFMLGHTQSGPNSWWESAAPPSAQDPWVGSHPAAGGGSSPHAWAMANANKVLLDSVVAEAADGTLIVGRGVPAAWLGLGQTIVVGSFPTIGGARLGLRITTLGLAVTLTFTGAAPASSVLFELPAFVGNIVSSSSGHVDAATGTVRIGPGIQTVTVTMAHAPAA